MPDSRVHMIRSARLRFGEAPRKFEGSDKYLRPQKSFLSIGMNQGHKAAHECFRPLLERGRVVWGSLVVARNDLFNKGGDDGRVVVTYCPHLHLHDNLDGLVNVSQTIMERRDNGSLAEVEIDLKEEVENNNSWFGPRHLPKLITSDEGIRVSSVMVVRKHLPQSRLVAGCFPILTNPEIDAVAILPERYWPQEIKDYWS